MDIQPSILWEIYKGVIFLDRQLHPVETPYTEQEFTDLIAKVPGDWKAINFYGRVTWLQENGYDLTQDNIINGDLPTRPDMINTKPELDDVYNTLPQAYWDLRDSLQQQIDKLDEVIYAAKQDPTQTVDLATQAVQEVQGAVTITPTEPIGG